MQEIKKMSIKVFRFVAELQLINYGMYVCCPTLVELDQLLRIFMTTNTSILLNFTGRINVIELQEVSCIAVIICTCVL